ncbi:MAG: NAD(P)H-dependent oxidoreductase subunit E [Myxococcales bacterium]|nr:NAD(P)H-dependent oxidoreductase subunit E [Myxococcales bacterium]
MDLKPLSSGPSPEERAAVDAVLGPPDAAPGAPRGLAWASAHRHLLLPALRAVVRRVGWVRPGALGYVVERLHVPPAEAYGVASFYALLPLDARPPAVLHVCDDVACRARGAAEGVAALRASFGEAGTVRDGATFHTSPCLGLCERAPAALLTVAGEAPREEAFGAVTVERAREALATRRAPEDVRPPLPQRGAPELRLLARVGRVDPTDLDAYRAAGGYQALRRALELGPAAVVRALTEAGLLGRGGAAFPTGKKWQAVAQAAVRPHYVVCNADESEPGTFKDRVLLEEDPFALVEAMTIAGFAVGAEKGYVYLRGEYPLAAARVAAAIAQARARGLLGPDVLGRGLSFDLELCRGAGAYVCGEETALFNSLEGRRGEPRNKPPFPVEAGLFGKPTVVNNVETLANVPWLLLHGARTYRSVGTAGSPGTRLFCLSGCVVEPGVYEHPFGVTLRAVLERAGGVPSGRSLRAVLLGGAAGSFVGPGELELPLTFEDTKQAGVSLGSGVVLVLDDTVALEPLLLRIAAFFRDESCGQCVPCRVGTERQEELVQRLCAGRPEGSRATELALLAELGQAMRDASICGLGQTASSAIESAVVRLGLWKGGAS